LSFEQSKKVYEKIKNNMGDNHLDLFKSPNKNSLTPI
jgi:hypothetical protein